MLKSSNSILQSLEYVSVEDKTLKKKSFCLCYIYNSSWRVCNRCRKIQASCPVVQTRGKSYLQISKHISFLHVYRVSYFSKTVPLMNSLYLGYDMTLNWCVTHKMPVWCAFYWSTSDSLVCLNNKECHSLYLNVQIHYNSSYPSKYFWHLE